MSRDNPYDGEISSAEEFNHLLEQLVSAAAWNDIDPRGSWEVRNGDGLPDWEAMIVELEKPASDD